MSMTCLRTRKQMIQFEELCVCESLYAFNAVSKWNESLALAWTADLGEQQLLSFDVWLGPACIPCSDQLPFFKICDYVMHESQSCLTGLKAPANPKSRECESSEHLHYLFCSWNGFCGWMGWGGGVGWGLRSGMAFWIRSSKQGIDDSGRDDWQDEGWKQVPRSELCVNKVTEY